MSIHCQQAAPLLCGLQLRDGDMRSLLDLPTDVVLIICSHMPWSARATCRTLRNLIEHTRHTLAINADRQPSPTDSGAPALLRRLPQLRRLSYPMCPPVVVPHVASLQLTSLALEQCSVRDVAPLAACTALTSLSLAGCPRLYSLRPLSACTALTSLSLSGCHHLISLGPLAPCVRLVSLDASHTCISSVRGLARMASLTHLDLSDCDLIHSIDPLAACALLQDVNLSGCHSIRSARPLGRCGLLVSLRLKDIYLLEATNLMTVACPSLQSLHLLECLQLYTATPLALHAALTHLSLAGCTNLTDVHALPACTNLTTLCLWSCSQLADVSALVRCPLLQSLDLCGCRRITTLGAPRPTYPSLTSLSCASCRQLTEVGPGACASLTFLDLSYCVALTGVASLAACQALVEVDTRGASRAARRGWREVQGARWWEGVRNPLQGWLQ